jgi:hypothetical protein
MVGMRRKFLILAVALALSLGASPAVALGGDVTNDKRYELPYYETFIKVSNVVSDNSSQYISTTNDEIDPGVFVEHTIVRDLYIEATAPCKVTYSQGDQYIHYAKKLADGKFDADYDRPRIKFDVEKYTLFTRGKDGDFVFGKTVDQEPDDGMSVGAEGNYVTLSEGTYIVSYYDPSLRHAGGQAFSDYDVILTVKANVPASATATPNASTVLVNRTPRTFDAYTINDSNYFKLRDLAAALNGSGKQFEVTWDGAKNAINLLANKPYTVVGGEMTIGTGATAQNAALSTAKIFIDGKEVALTAYTINDSNYFKLRDIAKAFDIGVTWDAATSSIGIDTSIRYGN